MKLRLKVNDTDDDVIEIWDRKMFVAVVHEELFWDDDAISEALHNNGEAWVCITLAPDPLEGK